MRRKSVSIIIPVCNEKGNVPLMITAVSEVMNKLPYDYHFMFVDDGSNDGTLETLRSWASMNNRVYFVSLSRNFGHQNALKAGIDASYGDCIISMDGDLQHPPDLLPVLLEEWEKGHDIVYTIRRDHMELPMLKRKTSTLFYKILNGLSDIELESGTADFRLIDKKVVDILRTVHEADLFWRGLVKWTGFKQIGIEYDPAERREGKSKYTYKKMMQLAMRGLTSFSTKPLTIAIYIGFFMSFLSLLYIPYILYSLYSGHAISGWASILVTIVFFGGLQLMILGIIGVYIGKIFMQSKQRPHYIIRETNL